MSNIGYDLDTSGGLMPLIRALIKPPDEEVSVQKAKKSQHPYYKRPGKGHNHDSCDACGEGGDLICCDRCPASFHLGCYDPPLDPADIPSGLWLCKQCTASDEKPASTKSSRAQSPAETKNENEKKTRSLRNRANSKKSKDELEENEEEVKNDKDLTPMEILVKAARVMNPKQFDLPQEMKQPFLFPGTDKEGSKNGNAALITVDSWGCVPLPAKTCYVCQGTCKLAPLLQCDYCPALFHLDCLDPPLTALPTGRWMCPNHVENFIDWKLVSSISAVERAALWDRFGAPIDQHAVKVDFIRRARRHTYRVPMGVRGRVVVPRCVRAHYRRPPPLLPSRREHVRCRNVLKNRLPSESESEDDAESTHKICLNTDCPKYSEGECPVEKPELIGASAKDAEDDLKAIEGDVEAPKSEDKSSESSDSDIDPDYLLRVKRRKARSEDTSPGKRGKGERVKLRGGQDVEELLAVVEKQLDKLDERLVRVLAWQRLQEVALGERASGKWRAATDELGSKAAAAIRHVERSQLAKHGLRCTTLPSELLARADRERIATLVWGAPPPKNPVAIKSEALEAALKRMIACITQLHQTDGKTGDVTLGVSIPMRLSSLTIGTDASCGVQLDSYCRHVSGKHAVIFKDEVSGHFELINYSEWGTVVNGVMYACELSGCDSKQEDEETRPSALRHLTDKTRKERRLKDAITQPLGDERECQCPLTPPSSSAAWEGSALVPHGALLQFGCLLYVFSDADPKPFPYEQPIEEPAL
ncbi:unnamed protein product [Leptosia nina]|uniref:PHD finger protein 12 n=1 Tax=Leptosia nina TaxID=320188 RepID=A0AAV1IWX9_9NEOP